MVVVVIVYHCNLQENYENRIYLSIYLLKLKGQHV